MLQLDAGDFLPGSEDDPLPVAVYTPERRVSVVLNSYRRFNDWSPWLEADPHAKMTISGPASGVGAKFAWSGNKEVGTGSQEIVESKPNEIVKTALDFGEMGKPNAAFRLTPTAHGGKAPGTLVDSRTPRWAPECPRSRRACSLGPCSPGKNA